MPEALVTVPPLYIPSENSSEFENPSTAAEITDRSTDSRIYRREIKLANKSQVKNKLRKSAAKRSQKKTPLRPLTCERKLSSAALKLKSHIPRAVVLTPSSSTTSLTTSDSSCLPSPLPSSSQSPLINISQTELTKANSDRPPCIVRQKSAIIIAFRQRKSFTEMDFNLARRPISFPIPSPIPNRYSKDSSENEDNCNDNMLVAYPKNSFVHKMYKKDGYFPMSKRESQMAGMRIFSAIMLNAWRKRRDEVRRLSTELEELKRGTTKIKNQLHVFNTLFRVEQKRNAELNCRLKSSLADINLTKSSCEGLTTSLISLKADKALLEQQLQTKEQEFESVSSVLAQTKSELFKTMTLQRELQASLSMEQRQTQTVQNQKNELINEICELNNEALQKENKLHKEIQDKIDEIVKLTKILKEKDEYIKLLNQRTEQKINESKAKEERLVEEIQELQTELKLVQHCIEDTVPKRIKDYWNNSLPYQDVALDVIHCLIYSVLPAMPPPKITGLPFGLSVDKIMSIVRR